MRTCVLLVVAAFLIGMPSMSGTADLFEYFLGDRHAEARDVSNDDSLRNCNCAGFACTCCVDFNLTYIDLGGPGCVQMKYISQGEGLNLNVSYGGNLLHSQQVKGPNPNTTCMTLLPNIAEICARFSNLLSHNDGLRGCLLLEPKLLKAVTATFRIGCFTMGPDGMLLEDRNVTILSTSEKSEDDFFGNVTEIVQNETDPNKELLAVVNETAEQGLQFLGNLFNLAIGQLSSLEDDNETVSEGAGVDQERSTLHPQTT